jgi:hypothetical protein
MPRAKDVSEEQFAKDFENTCPDCGDDTNIVKLGAEPAREVCLAFPSCDWDGVTLE